MNDRFDDRNYRAVNIGEIIGSDWLNNFFALDLVPRH